MAFRFSFAYEIRTWTKGTDIDALKEKDPGLGIAASVPVHRLGVPEEVANVVSMYGIVLSIL